MKIIHPLSGGRGLTITILCFLFACHDRLEINHNEATEDPSSNDWIFMQRAFPAGQINPGSFAEVRAYHQQKVIALCDRNLLSSWEFSGPTNIGGRITDVEILPSSPNTYYAAAASGGVFKTENAGSTWKAIFDNEQTLAIGDIAIAPSDEKIIYVGTGEPNGGGGSIAYDGYGVYRSDDSGDTWSPIGLEQTGSISKIIVHPTNPDIAYAAAMGQLFSIGPERGLFRTVDGGQNWEKILFINDSTGIIDLVIHPNNPEILYAAAWQRVRTPFRRDYGGPSSGVYKSIDGGNNWQKLTIGLPEEAGRIGITISPSYPDILYAMYEHETSGYLKAVYRSANGGSTWIKKGITGIENAPYTYWFGKIFAHPVDSNEVYLTGLYLYKSINGGNTWSDIFGNMHLDQHAVAFHPDDPDIILVGNDGGVYRGEDGELDAIHLNTLPITQFYTCEIDHSFPKRFYGGAQDNSTMRTMTGSTNDWHIIYPGDGFRVLVDPVNNQYIYAEYQYGYFGRSIDGGSNFDYARDGLLGGDRFNWNTPFVLNPGNPAELFLGSQRLYKSINHAESWFEISPDLTENSSPSVTPFGTITSISVSPLNDEIIWVGTDNGNVQVTNDGGNTWTLVSSSLPIRWVTNITADPAEQNTTYVTYSGYRFGENVSHIYKTTDMGVSWTSISGDLPDMPVNDLIITEALHHLYIATDIGVFYSTDDGLNWDIVSDNLPNLIITDLDYHDEENILVAATYGRGIYKISPVAEITSVDMAQSGNPLNLQAFPNPFEDQVIFEFNAIVKQDYTIELIDIDGRRLKSIHRGPLQDGLHSFNINGLNLIPGIYFLSVTSPNSTYNSIVPICRN